MRTRLFQGVAVAALSAVGTVAHAAMLADFEPPTYEGDPGVQSDIDGVDGWRNGTGGNGVIFPDNISGYAPPAIPVLAGTQSYVLISGFQEKPFGAAGSQVGDGAILSTLYGIEALVSSNGTISGFYLSNNAAAAGVIGGIEAWGPTGTFAVWGVGGTVASAIPIVEDKHYLLEIELNVTDGVVDFFEGFVTGVTTPLARTSIGTRTLEGPAANRTVANIANIGGVFISSSGATGVYWDDIEINAIPEPAALGAMSFLGLLLFRLRQS